METIIIVSVLSTLGVVALVTAIVVAFVKLTKKVDVNDYDREVENIYNEVNKKVDTVYEALDNRIQDTERFVDSRCDKLDTKIKNLAKITTNGKQLLTD